MDKISSIDLSGNGMSSWTGPFTLIHEMQRRSELGESMRYGLVALCVGVGQGEATVIERI